MKYGKSNNIWGFIKNIGKAIFGMLVGKELRLTFDYLIPNVDITIILTPKNEVKDIIFHNKVYGTQETLAHNRDLIKRYNTAVGNYKMKMNRQSGKNLSKTDRTQFIDEVSMKLVYYP